jgi:hypothetical protein
MNVLYVGVENPISVMAKGISVSDLSVSAAGVKLRPVGNGQFIATASTPGEASIKLIGGGKVLSSQPYRIKRIPDPVARLATSTGGVIGAGEFKAQAGFSAFLDGFDFDVRCAVVGYELAYQPKRQDPISSSNQGPRYTAQSRRLVDQAKPGDVYYYTNVRAKCPGDQGIRKINSMVFMIR